MNEKLLSAENPYMDASSSCRLCPRECGAHRSRGEEGLCGAGREIRVARAALHFWEEPCISGTEGSGTVFFSGCSLRCVYCQNREISRGRAGAAVSPERLAEIFLELQEQKANNINLVTAGHYLPQVREALLLARAGGLSLPVVYNTSSYEKPELLRGLEGLVDIYLPDLKYLDPDLAWSYSRARDYPKRAMEAIGEMVRQVPETEFDSQGKMKKGVIVRHLLLPGHVKEGKRVVSYLHERYGNQIYISLMNQYTPTEEVKADPLLGRKVTRREYRRLLDYALEIGVEQGFFQEGDTAKESFIPPFDLEGI